MRGRPRRSRTCSCWGRAATRRRRRSSRCSRRPTSSRRPSGSGSRRSPRAALERYESWGTAVGSVSWAAIAARLRGLLAEDVEEADRCFEEAIERGYRRCVARSSWRAPGWSTASICAGRAAGWTPARTSVRRRRVRGARRGRLGGARQGRAAGQRRDVAPRGRRRAGAAHAAGAADRALRHRRRIEPRGRRPALREQADRRAPPEQDLLQARHQLTRRARAGTRRARATRGASGTCRR